MNTNQIRQGDVLLVRIKEPAKFQATTASNSHGCVVLAQGESTLHEHTISAEHAEFDGSTLHVKASCAVLKTTHSHTGKTLPRHTPQEIGEGYYRIVRQRELSMNELRASLVRD